MASSRAVRASTLAARKRQAPRFLDTKKQKRVRKNSNIAEPVVNLNPNVQQPPAQQPRPGTPNSVYSTGDMLALDFARFTPFKVRPLSKYFGQLQTFRRTPAVRHLDFDKKAVEQGNQSSGGNGPRPDGSQQACAEQEKPSRKGRGMTRGKPLKTKKSE